MTGEVMTKIASVPSTLTYTKRPTGGLEEGIVWVVLHSPLSGLTVGISIRKKCKFLYDEQINKTIKALKLNSDDSLVQGRCNMMLHFAKEEITLSFLKQRYPFLASEIVRQGIETTAHTLFKQRTVTS